MAKKKRSSNLSVRYKAYLVGILIGALALLANIFIFPSPSPVWQNVLNWTVGIGLVGGLLFFLTDFLLEKI